MPPSAAGGDNTPVSLESNLMTTIKKANGGLFLSLQAKNRQLQAFEQKEAMLDSLKQQYELQLAEFQQFYSGLGDIFQNMAAVLPDVPETHRLGPYMSKTAIKSLTSTTDLEASTSAKSKSRQQQQLEPSEDSVAPHTIATVYSNYLGLAASLKASRKKGGAGDSTSSRATTSSRMSDDETDDSDDDGDDVLDDDFFDTEEKYHQQDAILQADFLAFRKISKRVKTDLGRKRTSIATGLNSIVQALSRQAAVNTALLSSPHATALIATASAAQARDGVAEDSLLNEEDLTSQLAKQVEQLRRITIEQQRTINSNRSTNSTMEQSLLHYKALAQQLQHRVKAQDEKIAQFEKIADRHRFTQNELFSQESHESTNDDLAEFYRAELMTKRAENGTASTNDGDKTDGTAKQSTANSTSLTQVETLQQLTDISAQLATIRQELITSQAENVTLKDENDLLQKQVLLVQAQQVELFHGHLATMSTDLATMTQLHQIAPAPPQLPAASAVGSSTAGTSAAAVAIQQTFAISQTPTPQQSQQLSILAKQLGIQLTNYQQVNQAFALAVRTLLQHSTNANSQQMQQGSSSTNSSFAFTTHTTIPTMQFISFVLIFNSAFTQLSQQHQHEFVARQTLSKQLKLFQQQHVDSVNHFQNSLRAITAKAQAIQYRRNVDFEQLLLEKHTAAVQVQQLADELYHLRSQLLHDPSLAQQTVLSKHVQRIKDLEKRLLIQELVNKELLIQANSSNIQTQIKTKSVTFVRFLYNMLINVRVDAELKIRAMEEKLIRQTGIVNYHGWAQNQVNAQNLFDKNASVGLGLGPQLGQIYANGQSHYNNCGGKEDDAMRIVQLRGLFQQQVKRVSKQQQPPLSRLPPQQQPTQQTQQSMGRSISTSGGDGVRDNRHGPANRRSTTHHNNNNYNSTTNYNNTSMTDSHHDNNNNNNNNNDDDDNRNFKGRGGGDNFGSSFHEYEPDHRHPSNSRHSYDPLPPPPSVPNYYGSGSSSHINHNNNNPNNNNNNNNYYGSNNTNHHGGESQNNNTNLAPGATTSTPQTQAPPVAPTRTQLVSAPPNIPLGLRFRPNQLDPKQTHPLIDLNQAPNDSSHVTPLVGILDSTISGHASSFYDSFTYPFTKHYKQYAAPDKTPEHSTVPSTLAKNINSTATTNNTNINTSTNDNTRQPIPFPKRKLQRRRFLRALGRLRSVPYHTYHQLQESHFAIWVRCAYMFQYTKRLQNLCLTNQITTPPFNPPIHPNQIAALAQNPSSQQTPSTTPPLNFNIHTLYDWHYDPNNINHFDQMSSKLDFNIQNDAQLSKLSQSDQIKALKSKIAELQLDLDTSNDIIREMEPIVNRSEIISEPSLLTERRSEYSRVEQYEQYIANLETKLSSCISYIDNFKHLHTYQLPAETPFHLDGLLTTSSTTSSTMGDFSSNPPQGQNDSGTTNANNPSNPNVLSGTSTNTTTSNSGSSSTAVTNVTPGKIVTNVTSNFYVRSTFALQDVCRILTRQVLNLSSQLETTRHNSIATNQQIDFHKTQSASIKAEMGRLLQLIDLIVTSSASSNTPTQPKSSLQSSSSAVAGAGTSTSSHHNSDTAKYYEQYLKLQTRIFNTLHQLYIKFPILNAHRNQSLLTSLQTLSPSSTTASASASTGTGTGTSSSSVAASLATAPIMPLLARQLAATIKSSTYSTAVKNKMIRFASQIHAFQQKLDRQAKEVHSTTTKLTKSQEEYNRLFAQNDQVQKQLVQAQTTAKTNKSNDRETDNLLSKVMCSICSVREKSAVIIGCGHTLCMTCMDDSLRARNRKCPLCATTISQSQIYQMRL